MTLRISKQEQKIVVNDNNSCDHDKNDNKFPGSENGAGLSWEHGQLHPGLFSHHEYDYG